MNRIRYVAIVSPDPRALASYYCSTFGMRRLSEATGGDLSITDGAMKIAIFKMRDDLSETRIEPGLHHLGVEVSDFESCKARFRRLNPRAVMVPEDKGDQYGELRFYDPESIPVSLSRRSFGLENSSESGARITHVGIDTLDPDAEGNFYEYVFGFTNEMVTEGAGERRDRWMSDGACDVRIHYHFSEGSGPRRRYGVNCLGIEIDEEAVLSRVPGAVRLKGVDVYEAQDPEGNLLLLLPATASRSIGRWRRLS